MIQKEPHQTKTQKSHKDFIRFFVDAEIGHQNRSKFAHFVGSKGWGSDIDCMWDKREMSPIEW